ncbi:MAG: polysaccharide biosynthesis tyrosine autokinase [Terracidiphilus sp.]
MQFDQEQDPTLRDLLRIFDRRRQILRWTAASIFLLSICTCVFMTRRYTATSEIQLQKSSSDGLDLESMLGSASGGASDSMSVNLDLQTQSSILQSEELELKVIKDLHLEQNEDFRPHFSLIGTALSWISPAGSKDPEHVELDNAPLRRAHALKIFNKNLKVKVVAGTRLLDVSYSNPDPKVAADVTNHLIQGLIDYTFQTKFQATSEASTWLEGQLGDLRDKSENLQAKVVDLQKDTGLFGVGGSDLQGKPIIYSPVLDRLQQSTAELSQAQENRVIKGAVYEIVKTGNAEQISQLSGTSIGGSTSQGVQNSLAFLQTLRAQEATLQAQIGQDAATFGAAYPKLIDERASLKRVQQLLQDEIDRMAARAKNDYEIALKTEKGSMATYDLQRQSAEKLNDKTIAYSILEKEATQSQDLYQDLLKRLKEAGILEGLHSSNLTVVYKASPPAKPSKPNIPLYLILGLGIGIFLGGAAALLMDAVDNKVQGPDEIEKMGIPLLGILPHFDTASSSSGLLVRDDPNAVFSEAIRSFRSVLFISRSGRPPQVILVTSPNASEGKSTLSLNLAAALAQQEKRVLLLETDLRRPVLRRRMNLPGTGGLSTILSDQAQLVDVFSSEAQPNLYFMPSGPTPPFPAEMLGAPRMAQLLEAWRTQFDFIVIDSPPILPIADIRALVPLADTAVLVARAGRTTRVALKRSYGILLQHAKEKGVPATGVVLNAISLHSEGYYGYYGYYGHGNSSYYGEGGKK